MFDFDVFVFLVKVEVWYSYGIDKILYWLIIVFYWGLVEKIVME